MEMEYDTIRALIVIFEFFKFLKASGTRYADRENSIV